MNHFSELNLNPALHRSLASNLFLRPTPVQAKAIPAALTGSDVIATAPTGTGKTVAFVLPVLEKVLTAARGGSESSPNIRALILSPTRELALQISDTLAKLSAGTKLRAGVVVGGLSEQTQLNALRKGVDVVIATPGRLEDFLGRRLINLGAIETLVLDEADRMLDMGFLPAIERILGRLPGKRQSLFFSATMHKSVEHLTRRHSSEPVRISVGDPVSKAPEEIDLHVYEVENDRKLGLLQHMLGRSSGSFLVFVRTKHGTDRLAKRLS
ncbi:MAG: DEAD/DEAH box helicase, partial [Acidobacteriaceae bacterium]|nr:DEAD/DEAH box helicase [Acidobacteriaceae bacterium]